MSITIRHLDGPLAGREQHFDDSVPTILFGRSAEAQVVYPEECLEVDGEHLRLNRDDDGSWRLELGGSYDVDLDGKTAEDNDRVNSGCVITVGVGGPRFEVLFPGITIKHLEGPLAGISQYFADDVATIIFGRSREEAQVVYPPEYSIVGRRHFALKRSRHGDYRTELFGQRYVSVDGNPVDNGEVVSSGSLFRLGRHDGPSFSIEIERGPRAGVATAKQSSKSGWFANWGRASNESAQPTRPARRDSGQSPKNVKPAPPPPERQAPSVPAGEERGVAALFVARQRARPIARGLPEDAFDAAPSAPVQTSVRASYSPSAGERMRMREPSASLWWLLATAAAIGALWYFLWRRDIALGEVLNVIPAMTPPPNAAPDGEVVEASVFGPTAVKAGGECLIQVLLHRLDQREIAKALAQETDPDATRRGVQTLAAEIARGQRVQILLEGRGLSVDGEMQTLVWRGEPCACQFTLSAPEDAAGRTIHPRILVLVDSVPVGSLTFALKITAKAVSKAEPELRGDRARRYAYAFLSYASPDRAEVIKRAQGLRAGGTSFFNDLLSLEPGERWEKRLYEEIDRCDVFYLFWSSQAKASEWVMKEIEYALARRLTSENADPDIIPVIIEGPPPPSPPESLKDIHFNDSLLYVLAGNA